MALWTCVWFIELFYCIVCRFFIVTSLSLLKLVHMTFYSIDLQIDFWYTVCIYRMI